VLEGGEGAGKSTHAQWVRDWLRARGRDVLLTREPGGSPLAEAIRELILRDWDDGMPPLTELLLIFAARAAHVHARIEPALSAGTDVVCDRFVDASYAYQGAGRELGSASVAALEKLVLGSLRPDLVLVLDIDPEEGLRRTKHRGEENRFEAETLQFMRRVRQAYLDRAAEGKSRYAVIDAARSKDLVEADIAKILEQKWPV